MKHRERAGAETLFAELRHTECAYYFKVYLFFRIHYKIHHSMYR